MARTLCALFGLTASALTAIHAAPLSSPLTELPDAVGGALQNMLVWTPPDAKPQPPFVAFRRSFDLPFAQRTATLHVFADSRYLVWINGKYVAFPVTLEANQKLAFTTDHLVQAYTVLDLEADAGTELSLDYASIKYVARAGRQMYISSDTHAFFGGTITVKSGRATIHSLKLVERLYPFDVAGSFKSSDEALNKLSALCARSCQIFSEDSYVDCAERERVEWMDDDPPAFNVTRTAMAGPKPGGGLLYSDPRLLQELLRRTALTVQPEGG